MVVETASGEDGHFLILTCYGREEAVKLRLAHSLWQTVRLFQPQVGRHVAVEIIER